MTRENAMMLAACAGVVTGASINLVVIIVNGSLTELAQIISSAAMIIMGCCMWVWYSERKGQP